jgi:DNA-binding transcriptional ArsR family regulator
MKTMDPHPARPLSEILKDKNIVLRGADAATAMGFTQVPNFLLKAKKLSSGDKMAFAMLLSYAWQNDYCFPGQERLAQDLGLSDRSVRTHLKSLEKNGLLRIKRRGQGRTNIYELDLKPPRFSHPDRKKTSGLGRKETSAPERKGTSGPL